MNGIAPLAGVYHGKKLRNWTQLASIGIFVRDKVVV